MKIIKTKIKDLLILKQKNNFDKRGSLRETFSKKILKKKFIFEYCTTSKANALRGFHFQYKYQQAKYVSVLKGKILDYVIDLRKNSKTFGKSFSVVLSQKNCKSIYIPAGFAHGFLSLENDSIVYYSCTEYRSPKNECSMNYNDPILKIKWPKKKIIISDKDKSAKNFNELLKEKVI